MREPTYPESIATALRVNGEQIEADARRALITATRCGWCSKEKAAGALCCNAEPWRTA